MRKIIFRGKRRDNGEWVYGSLFVGFKKSYICPESIAMYNFDGALCLGGFVEVSPESVGQYTGLTDKNGKKIFEGDIVRTHYANTRKNDFVEQVVFHNGRFCSLYKIPGPGNGKMWASLPDGIPNKTPYMEWCEVIGNIHDNQELLKEEAQT